MSLFNILSAGTTSTYLIKSLISGLVVAGAEIDPRLELNIAVLANKPDGDMNSAIVMHYIMAFFAADMFYPLVYPAAEFYYTVAKFYYTMAILPYTLVKFIWLVIQDDTEDYTWDWRREVVVVSGGSSGVGALIASQLAVYRIRVVILDAEPPEETTTLLQLKNVFFYQTNTTSPGSIADVAWVIQREVGHPTVLINNVGTGFSKPILEETEAQIRKTFDANTAALLLVKQFVPHMVRWDHGHVVTVASFDALESNIGYSCTQAATLAFHEGLKKELKHRSKAYKVRTTCVEAPSFSSPFLSHQSPTQPPSTCAQRLTSHSQHRTPSSATNASDRDVHIQSQPEKTRPRARDGRESSGISASQSRERRAHITRSVERLFSASTRFRLV
jgi:short-subunit dehydrogenase